MRVSVVLAALLFCAGLSHAGPCKVPAFEEFVPSKQTPPADTVQVVMQPVARLNIPSGFSKMWLMPNGSASFGKHPRSISIHLSFETQEFVSIHKPGATPAQFFLSIFKGLDAVGCQYLDATRLGSEDYRLHAVLDGGAELFAFGNGERAQFHLIRTDKPDLVLTGWFKKVSRTEFESLLSGLSIFATN